MKMLQIPKTQFDFFKNEQHLLSDLTTEVFQALKFFDEHPQYPLNLSKIKEKIFQINERMQILEKSLNEYNNSKKINNEDTSTEIWL